MSGRQTHYEILARRRGGAGFVLEGACESRSQAMELAEELLEDGRAAAVRVSKEVMDPVSGEFTSAVILEKGDLSERGGKRPTRGASRQESPCTSPHDLYNLHARETIARLLADWLSRRQVTAYELLHRPDLLELLESSGVEIQHALQRISVPEAQATGRSVHDVLRGYMGLVDRAIQRVLKDGRRGAFPALTLDLSSAIARTAGQPDAEYLIGGGVAAALADAEGWPSKLERLLDLAERASALGDAGAVVLQALQKPLIEMLEGRAGLSDLLGVEGDAGCSLGALVRLVAAAEVGLVFRLDPRAAALLPQLTGPAERLSQLFGRGAFPAARRAVARRVLKELEGPRRLRPSDVDGEIEVLRALAMALTATGAALVDPEDVRRAFVERSRALLSPEFVSALLNGRNSVLAEAEALVWLSENVAGSANKRAAARLINATITSHRLDAELTGTGEPPAARLATLARMQKAVLGAGFQPEDAQALIRVLGELGDRVETRARLIAALVRVDAAPAHKLFLLSKLAAGDAAPVGPVTERARSEVFRLLRRPEARAQLAASPELRDRLASLLPAAAA